jgi:hypothetical protein
MTAENNREQLGPFDLTELGVVDNFIDFGAILVPADNPDIKLRIEVEESTGKLVAVTLEHLDSTLKVTAFSAPKTDGVWAGARDQLAETVLAQGGKVSYVETGFAKTLQAEFMLDGSSDIRTLRFIGVDGPRWFLRGTIEGAALTDVAIESAIESLFRSVVVNRGVSAMPPGEMLELAMPPGNVAPPRGF